ncbi:matrixin family metalloprotease [Mesorhizobium sp. M0898]|uniref:matrixin family metalloprotease n=1 Tax=Mesorhizobium sp. M0898 TaxID=2957020 RepID=UPI003336E38D
MLHRPSIQTIVIAAFLLSTIHMVAAQDAPSSNSDNNGAEEYICSTPQFSEFDRIVPSDGVNFGQGGTTLFLYNSDRELTLRKERISSETVVTQKDFQLLLGSDAWTPGDGLSGSSAERIRLAVAFLDGSEAQRALVRKYVPQWTAANGAPVEFIFAEGSEGQIRITFDENGNWSLIGRQARNAKPWEPTMSLEDVDAGASETRARRVILHEFGHALGLRHEHQHPSSGITWAEEVVHADMAARGWSRAMTKRNILDGLGVNYMCRGAPNFDPSSIMLYPIPARWTKGTFSSGTNSVLVPGDLACARSAY